MQRRAFVIVVTAAWAVCGLPAGSLGDAPDPPAEATQEAEVDPTIDGAVDAEAGTTSPAAPPPDPLDPALSLSQLRSRLGEAAPLHWVEPTEELVRQGRELVVDGRTTDARGRPSRVASPGFLCIDCHNVQREDPDLRVADPEARLDYVAETGQPFLPGTTLWGAVDRTSWFNGDYVRKYGSLVEPANRSLREAVLLCAAECSQGRIMEDWELDAILAYLWTLEITLGDLDLDEAGLNLLAHAVSDPDLHQEARELLDAAYLTAAPATVRQEPADKGAGYGNEGDPARGELLYRKSCLTCHEATPGDKRGVRGTFPLDAGKRTIAMLWRKRTSSTNLSFHKVITHGTRPYGVPMAYMPFFTKERMSDQQVDDLMAWFEAAAGGGE